MKSLRAVLADWARALWVAATDSRRDPVCVDCRCPIRNHKEH